MKRTARAKAASFGLSNLIPDERDDLDGHGGDGLEGIGGQIGCETTPLHDHGLAIAATASRSSPRCLATVRQDDAADGLERVAPSARTVGHRRGTAVMTSSDSDTNG
jgi:hypothetical protein